MVRSMMCFTNLPLSFWRYTLEAAAYILNKVPSKSISSILYKIWKRKRSNLKHLKIWGCTAYVKNIDGHKLDARSKIYRSIGYPKESIGYYFYNPTQQKIFLVGMSFFWRKSLSKKEAVGGLLNLRNSTLWKSWGSV